MLKSCPGIVSAVRKTTRNIYSADNHDASTVSPSGASLCNKEDSLSDGSSPEKRRRKDKESKDSSLHNVH